jgi:hypothetical protein
LQVAANSTKPQNPQLAIAFPWPSTSTLLPLPFFPQS